jgi:hypothetical protein
LGQYWNASADWFCAEIDLISLDSSARSMGLPALPPGAIMNVEIDLNRRRAADLGTRQV